MILKSLRLKLFVVSEEEMTSLFGSMVVSLVSLQQKLTIMIERPKGQYVGGACGAHKPFS